MIFVAKFENSKTTGGTARTGTIAEAKEIK